MHTAYYNEYSYHLDRMMEFKVYWSCQGRALSGISGAERPVL